MTASAETFGDLFPDAPADLAEVFRKNAQFHAARPALVSLQQPLKPLRTLASVFPAHDDRRRVSWSYEELYSHAVSLAVRFTTYGINQGDTIVMLSRPGLEFILVLWAAVLMRCPLMPLDPRSVARPAELRSQFDKTRPRAVLVEDGLMSEQLLGAVGSAHRDNVRCLVVLDGESAGFHGIKQATAVPWVWRKYNGEAILILFTSGTTAESKACPWDANTLCTSILRIQQLRRFRQSSVVIYPLPTYHGFGLLFANVGWLVGGAVIIPERFFDAVTVLDAIAAEHVTHLPATVPMMHSLINEFRHRARDLTSLEVVDLGGMVLERKVRDLCIKELGLRHIDSFYGSTETGAVLMPLAGNSPTDYLDVVSSGQVGLHGGVRICLPGTRTVLGRGIVGELHVGGTTVIQGYIGFQSSDLYADDGGRWIATGDRAMMDESGNVFVFGRYKDLIIRGGVNISPVVIENCLNEVPSIQSQVIPVPDEVAGELPFAVIIRSGEADSSSSITSLMGKVITDLGSQYALKGIMTIGEDLDIGDFPRTPLGKIRKEILKNLVLLQLSLRPDGLALNKHLSTQEKLRKIWSLVTGLNESTIDLESPTKFFADSLTTIEYCSKVRKDLRKYISKKDIDAHPTITSQAILLDSRKEITTGPEPPVSGSSHNGLILHTELSIKEVEKSADSILKTLDLSWADVEDVLPLPDRYHYTLPRYRAHSWDLRQILVTTGSSTVQLQQALCETLQHHAMFRALLVRCDAIPLYLVIRPSDLWYSKSISSGISVGTIDELKSLHLDDPILDTALEPGPLFRAKVIHVKETGNAAVLINIHHCICDAASVSMFNKDLNEYLGDAQGSLAVSRTPYKVYVDKYFEGYHSATAKASVDFHLQRLKGIGLHEESLWPKPRAPQWFRGPWESWWKHLDGRSGQPEERIRLPGNPATGISASNHIIVIPDLVDLLLEHKVPAPVLFKAGIALFNAKQTGGQEAMWGNTEAGREWPFMEEADSEALAHPFDIAGPTWECTYDRIRINWAETTLAFLQRLTADQDQLTTHAHAPSHAIDEGLKKIDTADYSVAMSAVRRQVVGWPPDLLKKSFGPDSKLQKLQLLVRSDMGFAWTGGLVDEKTLFLNTSWDAAQVTGEEGVSYSRVALAAMAWLANKQNWECALSDTIFYVDGIKQIPA